MTTEQNTAPNGVDRLAGHIADAIDTLKLIVTFGFLAGVVIMFCLMRDRGLELLPQWFLALHGIGILTAGLIFSVMVAGLSVMFTHSFRSVKIIALPVVFFQFMFGVLGLPMMMGADASPVALPLWFLTAIAVLGLLGAWGGPVAALLVAKKSAR